MLKNSQYINITPDSQIGYVYGTEFEFSFVENNANYTQFAWDLGDGTFFYDVSSVKYTYNFPGIYNISLSAFTNQGEFLTDFIQINVDYYYRDAMLISQVPDEFGLPSAITKVPFVVSLTSAKINEPIAISLQALNTKSIPHYAVPQKWDFLIPRWRFLDGQTFETINETITINPTPLYYNNKIVAVSGKAEFFYVDDLATGIDQTEDCPLLITATLSTLEFTYPKESLIYPYYSYSNSEVTRAVIAWQINDTIPTKLKVSENYLNDIFVTKWQNVPIPVMITCEFDPTIIPNYEFYSTKEVTKVLSYPKSNVFGKQHPVVLSLSSDKTGVLEPSAYKLEHAVEASYSIFSNTVTVTSPNHGFQNEDFCYCRTIEGTLPSAWYYSLTALNNKIFTFSTNENTADSSGVLYFEKPLYFQTYDEQDNLTTGYIFTSITPLFSSDSSIVVHANTIATNNLKTDTEAFSYPNGFPVYPYVYISHPYKNTINRLSIVTYPSKCTNIQYYKDLNLLLDGTLSLVETPKVSTSDVSNYELSGHSGVYGLAFNPVANLLYASDADANTLLSFDKGMELLTSIQLSSVTQDTFNTPSYISIDGHSNVWVTLYNKYATLKFDKNLNFILSAVPTTTIDLSSYSTIVTTSGVAIGDPFVAPPVVETDSENNIWVCYAHEDYSRLVKFNGYTGNEIVNITTTEGLAKSPNGLAIDKKNNVWVISYTSNSLQKFDSTGALLSTFDSLFLTPSYITLDKHQNVWVTHGYNLCGVLNTKTLETSSWKFEHDLRKTTYQATYNSEDEEYIKSNNEIWGGLTSDVFGRLWIINSETNTVGVFSPKEPTISRVVGVVPYVDKNYILNSNQNYVEEVPADNARSAQAVGDWTGNKWYQKYADTLASLPISGVSTGFNVFPLENSFQVAKVNEEFNCSEYLKSLAIPEYMDEFESFFDSFLPATVGTGNLSAEEIGRVVYEKIANFVENNSDYQTSEIKQLKSLAKEIGVDFKTYGIDFPTEINRLIQLFSIPKHRLRGRIKYDNNSENLLGNLLTSTSFVTADQYIFMKDRLYKNIIQQVYVVPITFQDQVYSVYPLSAIQIKGARTPLLDNYLFFEKKEIVLGYTNNLINWDSKQNTINFTLSTANEWYKDNGLVDTLFNNILTKRLFS